MHPYTTDSNERKFVPFYLAIASILAALGIAKFLQVQKITPPWWIDAPSVMALYCLFFRIFNRYVWRWGLLRKIRLINTPDLKGTWTGYITSSFDEHAERTNATVRIRQTWSQISVVLETDFSKSESLSGGIVTQDPQALSLTYEYRSEPRANALPTMHAHRGTAKMTIQPDSQTLEGEYYTGRDRANYGILRFQRER